MNLFLITVIRRMSKILHRRVSDIPPAARKGTLQLFSLGKLFIRVRLSLPDRCRGLNLGTGFCEEVRGRGKGGDVSDGFAIFFLTGE